MIVYFSLGKWWNCIVSWDVSNLEMSKKGELLITDKKEVIVNFKIPSRNKHGRTDQNLVDSST